MVDNDNLSMKKNLIWTGRYGMKISLAYTLKGCTPVEDLPVPNAYTNSFVICSRIYA